MKSIFTFIKSIAILLLLSSTVSAQSGNCSAKFVVENNGYVRSTPLTGTFYSLVLTNTGSSTDIYNLISSNQNGLLSSNPDSSNASLNVMLNSRFVDESDNVLTSISLEPGKTISFYLEIIVPTGTEYNKWNTMKVVAKSKLCTDSINDLVLHTHVIDVNEK